MLTRPELLSLLARMPNVQALQPSAIPAEGVSGNTLRAVVDGEPVVIAGTSQKHQFAALMDLIHLHLLDKNRSEGTRYLAAGTDPNQVTFVYVEDSPPNFETEDALRTLAASPVNGLSIQLKALSPSGQLRDITPEQLDFADDVKYRYTRFLGLLNAVPAEPPALLSDLCARAENPALRAYPRLAGGNWSLRLEGLEVGRFEGKTGTLSVGRDGKNGPGPERRLWIKAAGPDPLHLRLGDELALQHAIGVLKTFSGDLMPDFDETALADHNEHALESRVLRGEVTLQTSDGTNLALLKGSHPVINWGSQFPTRWGRHNHSSARYLDGLLRDGRTPWAVEIKIDRPALGVMSYYRQAVVQAVLYRQFIQTAPPLKPWFDKHDLDQTACRAAVVIPKFTALTPEDDTQTTKLKALCDVFDVELIQVDRHFAEHCTLSNR